MWVIYLSWFTTEVPGITIQWNLLSCHCFNQTIQCWSQQFWACFGLYGLQGIHGFGFFPPSVKDHSPLMTRSLLKSLQWQWLLLNLLKSSLASAGIISALWRHTPSFSRDKLEIYRERSTPFPYFRGCNPSSNWKHVNTAVKFDDLNCKQLRISQMLSYAGCIPGEISPAAASRPSQNLAAQSCKMDILPSHTYSVIICVCMYIYNLARTHTIWYNMYIYMHTIHYNITHYHTI